MGGTIAARLAEAGCDVIGVSRSRGGVPGAKQWVVADLGSLSFLDHMRSAGPVCEAIVHAAACLSKELYDPAVSLTNCLGTQQVLALGRLWGVKSLVYLSSVQVIGQPRYLPITEEHPTGPLTAYHASKLYGEYLVENAGRGGLWAAILRVTSPVGPRMPGNRILSVFVKQAVASQPFRLAGQGTRRQNYVDVRDVALAVEACLAGEVEGLFNIGGADSISNCDLALLCAHTLGSSSTITFTGQPDSEEGIAWDVSIAKARERFHYGPRYSLADSIRAVATEYATGHH